MTDITRSTLVNTVTEFIKSVLTENISGVDFWESELEKQAESLPSAFFEVSVEYNNRVLNGTRMSLVPVTIDMTVKAKTLLERDQTIDNIINVLSDETKTDANGNSLKSKYLRFKSATVTTDSIYERGYNKLIRVGDITINMVYYGA